MDKSFVVEGEHSGCRVDTTSGAVEGQQHVIHQLPVASEGGGWWCGMMGSMRLRGYGGKGDLCTRRGGPKPAMMGAQSSRATRKPGGG